MSFCNQVDDNNKLSGYDESFTIPQGGGYIYVVLNAKSDNTFNTHQIQLDIYKGTDFQNSLTVNIQPNWTFCYEKVTFYQKGNYRIDAYDTEQYNDLLEKYGMWKSTGYVGIDIEKGSR